MSRRLAHRPHHHLTRAYPRPLHHSQQEFLRQRWMYRQQRTSYAKRPLGFGLSLVPWGWRLVRNDVRRRA